MYSRWYTLHAYTITPYEIQFLLQDGSMSSLGHNISGMFIYFMMYKALLIIMYRVRLPH